MRIKASHIYMILVILAIGIYTYVYAITAERQIAIAKETSVYNRVTSCILSVPLATRTYDYINECYNEAEEHNNLEVKRFGSEREYR